MPNPPFNLLALLLLVTASATVAACDAPVSSGATTVVRQSLEPVIESLEPDPAAVGDEVTLHGYFHKIRRDDGLFVSFNGYDSMQVTHVSDTVITAVVPEGATSGNVVVVIGDSVTKGRFLKLRGKK